MIKNKIIASITFLITPLTLLSMEVSKESEQKLKPCKKKAKVTRTTSRYDLSTLIHCDTPDIRSLVDTIKDDDMEIEESSQNSTTKQNYDSKTLTQSVFALHTKLSSLKAMQAQGLSPCAMINLVQKHFDQTLKLSVYVYVSKQDYDSFAQSSAFLKLGEYFIGFNDLPNQLVGIAHLNRASADGQTANPFAKTEAWLRLGECGYSGRGLRQDYDLALSYFRKVINSTSIVDPSIRAKAYIWLGQCYFFNRGVTRCYSTAMTYFDSTLHEKNAHVSIKAWAHWYLALCFYYGYGLRSNMQLARDHFQEIINAKTDLRLTEKANQYIKQIDANGSLLTPDDLPEMH